MNLNRWLRLFCPSILLFVVVALSGAVTDEEAKHDAAEAAEKQASLSKFNPLIGSWRGVGRPRRYSAAEAWTEKAEWVWAFEHDGPSLRYKIGQGKQLVSAELFWEIKAQEFRLATEFSDKTTRDYRGKLEGRKLTVTSRPEKSGDVHRIQITLLNAKRTLVTFETQTGGRGLFKRVSEVGYTRSGTKLANDSRGGPECVVTGGLGTIAVSHAGVTYYVCCSGCKQVFDDDPAGTIARRSLSPKVIPSR